MALAVVIFFASIFALGSVQDLQAQASTSVSYTIVVTDAMIAGRGNDDCMRLERHALDSRGQTPQSFVSVHLEGMAGDNSQMPVFETEMSPGNAPAIAGMLEESFGPVYAKESDADLETRRIENDDREFVVVMEFN